MSDDLHRCQSAVDKVVQFAKENGTFAQYRRALEVQLPTSSLYDFLEGRLPPPSHTYTRLAEITESNERERINKEIGARKTRLGARIGQVTTEVKREVFGSSSLEELYQNIIDWSHDDELRRQYEEKLLQRGYDTLLILPKEQKPGKKDQVIKLAHGMVIIKHPFHLAWRIELEWKDFDQFEEWDVNVLEQFMEFFPEEGLSRVLNGYLSSDLTPFSTRLKSNDDLAEGEERPEIAISPEDRLLLMAVNFSPPSMTIDAKGDRTDSMAQRTHPWRIN